MFDLLLAFCLANTKIIKDNDPKLFYKEYNYAYTTEKGIFVAKSHKDDVFLTTHECGHYVDFTLLKGKSEKISTDWSSVYSPTPIDDPSISFYKLSWENFATMKEKAVFTEPYASTSPHEEFAVTFSDYIYNPELLDAPHKRQMRVLLGKAVRGLRKAK